MNQSSNVRVALVTGGGQGIVTGQNFVVDSGMTRKMIYAEQSGE